MTNFIKNIKLFILKKRPQKISGTIKNKRKDFINNLYSAF